VLCRCDFVVRSGPGLVHRSLAHLFGLVRPRPVCLGPARRARLRSAFCCGRPQGADRSCAYSVDARSNASVALNGASSRVTARKPNREPMPRAFRTTRRIDQPTGGLTNLARSPHATLHHVLLQPALSRPLPGVKQAVLTGPALGQRRPSRPTARQPTALAVLSSTSCRLRPTPIGGDGRILVPHARARGPSPS